MGFVDLRNKSITLSSFMMAMDFRFEVSEFLIVVLKLVSSGLVVLNILDVAGLETDKVLKCLDVDLEESVELLVVTSKDCLVVNGALKFVNILNILG